MTFGKQMKLIVFLALFGSVGAQAILPLTSKAGLRIPRDWESEWFVGWNKTYRMGDEWGKKPVTQGTLESESEAFQRAARATASVGGGTSFYLGKFNDQHVMATNHHVLETAAECKGKTAKFPLLEVKAVCDKFLGTWTDVDLSLYTIKVTDAAAEEKLAAVAANFDYDGDLANGQELITIGFGVADNPLREMVANRDSDCVVYSADKATDGVFAAGKNAFRFMSDPDELNPGPYKAWSFSNGCDVSHGDSGSAMVDRASSRVVGIIWTARIPKDPRVQTSKFLRELLKTPTEDVWKELSYAVPSRKIKDHLTKVLKEDGEMGEEARKTIQAVLGN